MPYPSAAPEQGHQRGSELPVETRPARPTIGSAKTDGAQKLTIETKDLVGWGITGSLGLLSLVLNWQTRRDTKRRAAQEDDAMWSLRRTRDYVAEDRFLFALTLRDPDQNRFRVNRLTLLRPRGGKISLASYETEADGQRRNVPVAFAPAVMVEGDLRPDRVLRGGHAYNSDSATLLFFVSPPAGRRSETSRLVVAIDSETISSSASRVRKKIHSEPIDWSTSADASAK